ncbi:MAG: hypothetical protein ABIP38_03140 [Steroidobacteraceae bacterium]
MQAHLKLFLIGVSTLAASSVSAAQAPAQPEKDAPRELLQPPKMSIASPITDRFAVRGLFYMPNVSTALRYDSSAGTPGTLISAEDTLGLQERLKQVSADMMFRILDRHRIRADFYKMTRSGAEVINQQILFGDDVYRVNDRVLTAMDLRKLGLTYTYSFLRREKWEVAAGIGLHLLQLEGTLDAPARFVSERLDTAGPFATLATEVTWRATKRFSANVAVNYLSGHIDDVKGGYQSYHGDVQFRARPNLAFGVGYSQARFKIDSTSVDFAGYFNLKYKGPEAFVRISY